MRKERKVDMTIIEGRVDGLTPIDVMHYDEKGNLVDFDSFENVEELHIYSKGKANKIEVDASRKVTFFLEGEYVCRFAEYQKGLLKCEPKERMEETK